MGIASTLTLSRPENSAEVRPPAARAEIAARIDTYVQRIPLGPSTLSLSGEAGIGKTTCWRYAVDACRNAGYRVLTARPSEEERFVPTAGLVDLFGAGDSGGQAWRTMDALRLRQSVLNLLRTEATTTPVVIAIDDAPWIDSVSGRTLRSALRRLDVEPIGLVTTARTSDAAEDKLAQAMGGGQVDRVHLGPLDPDALRGVLSTQLVSISRPRLRRLHRLSGGNPLYALELARHLDSDRHGADSDLDLPASLSAAIADRLDMLPQDLFHFLATLAAAGPCSLQLLCDVAGRELARHCLTNAEGLGLVAVGADLRLRFTHPLLSTAVYSRLGTFARHALHERLSQAVKDDDVRARHLALCHASPDEEVADLLEQAALRTRRQGAADLAADFARDSLRLTRAVDTEAVTRRSLLLVDALASAGEVCRARTLADDLVASLPPGLDRARVRIKQFYVGHEDYASGARILESALVDAGADRELQARLRDLLGWVRGMFCGDLDAGQRLGAEAVRIAAEVGLGDLSFSAGAHLAHMRTAAGVSGPDEMAEVVRGASAFDRPALGAGPQAWLAKQLLWAGALAESREQTASVLASDERSGNELERPYRLFDLAMVALSAGDLDDAEEQVRNGIVSARDADNLDAEGWLDYPLGLLHMNRGRADDATRAATRLLEPSGRPGGLPAVVRGLRIFGLLAMSQAEYVQAAARLTQAADLMLQWGVGNPGTVPVLPDAVEALVNAGDHGRARSLTDRLARQADAVGTRWASAQLDRCHGVLLLAEGYPESASPLLDQAAQVLGTLGHRLDSARVRRWQARCLIRSGRPTDAAAILTRARAALSAMGAVAWLPALDDDLARISRGYHVTLTGTEQAVTALAAQGRKNREIAQEMYIAVATVEAHLTRIYRKLAIRSRSELARLVANGSLSLET